MKGIILFGHGSRNPDWATPFHRIRDVIHASDPDALVECAFLELMSPTLDEAIDQLAAQGVTNIDIVPVFIASGGHIVRDLPDQARGGMQRHPNLRIEILAPIGEAANVIDAVARYALRRH